jgi:cytolysin (calcineurin-like family phosphatase)
LLSSGTYSLTLYANGVFLGTAQIVISSSPTLGNANCDTKIDGADVFAILDHVDGIPDSASCLGNADVDGDGHVTALDALLILKYWAGLISTFPASG